MSIDTVTATPITSDDLDHDAPLMRAFEEIAHTSAAESDVKRENANVDANTAMGAMLKYGSEGAKHFNLLRIVDPDHAKAHIDGDIHIHDLDFLTLTTTCCQIDLRTLFDGGFSTGHGVLRRPQSIASYAALACIAIQSNQNDQHGGQSIPDFDRVMADGVRLTYARSYRENLTRALTLRAPAPGLDRYDWEQIALRALGVLETARALRPALEPAAGQIDQERQALIEQIYAQLVENRADEGTVEPDLDGIDDAAVRAAQEFAASEAFRDTERATYQAMEALIHNLNTMNSRAGAQTPFSSINYGTDVSPEARLVIRALLAATEAGLGNGETPIFPIQIFRVKQGVNFDPGDPNYDLFRLACRCSAKRLFPNFSFQDAPFNAAHYDPARTETEIAYMGCRTRVIGNVHDADQEVCNRRGNLSFTSINLPRLALVAEGNHEDFFTLLDETLDLVVAQLWERLEIQSRKRVRNFPFLMGQGVWLGSEKLGPDDEVGEVLRHGSLSAGFIGLAEALTVLIGRHHGQTLQAQELGLRIVRRMRERMDQEAARSGLNFTLLATPAEGLAGRFVRLDRARFGDIPGVTDKEYYTNSFHVPVTYEITAARKITLEAPYHEMTNAGHITYVELDGDPGANLEAFEAIVRHMHASGIGYGSINHPVDLDPVCGYTGCIDDECPGCGRVETPDAPFDRIRRITGYLVGTLDRFNDAKRAEECDRVRHGLRSLGRSGSTPASGEAESRP
ncbi:anaerobic ribonucleoside triphosphate reductase [Austwickia chelonae]|uniref:anaerobic ribonucleoside triphosphate reductase n=1 Tax=Austwickia chelonae TaxID=100225 RepID=UPI000E289721|nr:anaerobic ribonucleoside triphosphate reductase [Austwickia chelonae]